MTFHLQSLSTTSSALCSVLDPSPVWPYTEQCNDSAVGVLMKQDIPEVLQMFDLRTDSNTVCQKHANRIDQYLTETRDSNDQS